MSCLFITTDLVSIHLKYFLRKDSPYLAGLYVIDQEEVEEDRYDIGQATFSKRPSLNEELSNESQTHSYEGFLVAWGIDNLHSLEKVVFLMLIERNGDTAEHIGDAKALGDKLLSFVENLPKHVSLMLQ
jgi:hypothetical protein